MMKTKVICFAVVALLLIGGLVACQATPKEETYKRVSVERVTVSIPTDWQRSEGSTESVETIKSSWDPQLAQSIEMDFYEVPGSKEAIINIIQWDMAKHTELLGESWEGWEVSLEAEGFSKEDFADLLSSGFIGNIDALTRTVHQQLDIQGYEAWESQFTGEMEGESKWLSLLVVYAENDAVVVLLFVNEDVRAKYATTWNKIRDSVECFSQR